MSDISLKVDANAGADCNDIIRQMATLSSRLNIDVESKLNGVLVVATPFCDVTRLCADWYAEMRTTHLHKIVIGRTHELRAVVTDPQPDKPNPSHSGESR